MTNDDSGARIQTGTASDSLTASITEQRARAEDDEYVTAFIQCGTCGRSMGQMTAPLSTIKRGRMCDDCRRAEIFTNRIIAAIEKAQAR